MDFRTEFFKELYYKELESKELQANRFTTNISLVTLLFAGLFFCIKNINDIVEVKYFYVFVIFSVISLIFDVLIVVFLLQHLWGKEYLFLPRASELDNYYKVLDEYATQPNTKETEDYFKDYIYKIYVETADHNFKVNDKRIKKMGQVNNLIVLSVITTLIALSCYIPTFFKEDANTQKVEIIEKINEQEEKAKNKEELQEVQNEQPKTK